MADKRHFDVIVVGMGSMGSAACHHLAGRGASVLGLDPFKVPHTHGSHHGHSRMIRQSYSEHPDYVPLLLRAYQLWEELDEQSETDLFNLTGAVYFGRTDGSLIPGALSAARSHGLPFELLENPDEIRSRFPAFRIPAGFVAFHEERAGYIVPEAAVRTFASAATALGADLREGVTVLDWKADGNGVEVITSQGVFRAGHLVITAGAWAGRLMKSIGSNLNVTRQVLAWFQPLEGPDLHELGRIPCWSIEDDPPFGHYGFPTGTDNRGLKLAIHKPGASIDPTEAHLAAHRPRKEETDSLHSFLKTFLPGGAGSLKESAVCLYTNTPDGHFIVGLHPGRENVSVACGFSGHGFKFAPVIGEVLADLATQRRTPHPIDFLSPGRFSR